MRDADPSIVEPAATIVVPMPFNSSLPRATLQMRLLAFSIAHFVAGAWRPTSRYRDQSGRVRYRKCSHRRILHAPRQRPVDWLPRRPDSPHPVRQHDQFAFRIDEDGVFVVSAFAPDIAATGKSPGRATAPLAFGADDGRGDDIRIMY